MPMSESITSRDEHEDYRDGMADLSAAVKLRSSIDPLKPNAFAHNGKQQCLRVQPRAV